MNILAKNFILFGSKLGQLKSGVDNTPNYLKNFLNNQSAITTINTVPIFPNDLFKNLNSLYGMNARQTNGNHKFCGLSNSFNSLNSLNSLSSLSSLNINIGGDHSMAIATVADSLNKVKFFDELKVIWFDAHPDINTFESSLTKNYHGMPLSFLTGLDKSSKLDFIDNKLKFQNLLYIGIRDIDKFEEQILKDYNISYILPKQFNTNYQYVIDTIDRFIGNGNNQINKNPIHISFDVDSIDPKYIPCTGTAVSEGLEMFQTKKVIDYLFKNHKIIGLDIVELNLELGKDSDKFKSLYNTIDLFRGTVFK